LSAPHREIAPAKLNLALHVRGRRPDGRHDIETAFAFCTDGDRLSGDPADTLSLQVTGPFAAELEGIDNLVIRAAEALRERTGTDAGARLQLTKNLPLASGLGGGSADAAAALRLLTAMWGTDPAAAEAVAPRIGSDVPACLLSLPAIGKGAGDELTPFDGAGIAGTPVLLINPRAPLSTADVFARWDGIDRGALGDWREGRNDLENAAVELVPQIGLVLAWLSAQDGATLIRMSGSGASCFAIFDSVAARDRAEEAVPREWWKLATWLR
jgi:4-diphosphocytidyl-2-C-methyl-D-erythritol kinase